MAKAKKEKAAPKADKAKRKVLTPEEKVAKKEAQAAKYETPVDKYVTLNETKSGKEVITTQAMQVRGYGCLVRTLSPNGISEVFVPGVKIKTKKTWKYLIKDSGKADKE